MDRDSAIENVSRYFHQGGFIEDLARRVRQPTESQNPGRREELQAYLEREMGRALEDLGFSWRVLPNPDASGGPLLVASREEPDAQLTVLGYAHGDVVLGMPDAWHSDLSPWELKIVGDRIYGRGTADNKGQHTINLAALRAVLRARGRLGFNMKLLIEMSEEVGSPGLRAFCAQHKSALKADVLIASDGPRLSAYRPTIFLGSRGSLNFELRVTAREGSHHSGNWGGLLSNPAVILSHALATITTATGAIQIPEWKPTSIPESVRAALNECDIEEDSHSPSITVNWGEPGLSPAEKLCAWSSFEILALDAGSPRKPVSAIPGRASAFCQLRYVVGVNADLIVPALQRHLVNHGFADVQVVEMADGRFAPTRLDPLHPWARWVAYSLQRTTGKKTAVMPSVGGSLPNDVFTEVLGMPAIWVPHSYGGCSQHAPNEHMLSSVAEEALRVMTGLYWDLGEITWTGAPAESLKLV